MGWARLPDRTF